MKIFSEAIIHEIPIWNSNKIDTIYLEHRNNGIFYMPQLGGQPIHIDDWKKRELKRAEGLEIKDRINASYAVTLDALNKGMFFGVSAPTDQAVLRAKLRKVIDRVHGAWLVLTGRVDVW